VSPGFKSLLLRHEKSTRKGAFFVAEQQGFEEAGPCKAGVKYMPVACFLGRGKIRGSGNASRRDVGTDPPQKPPAPARVLFLWRSSRDLKRPAPAKQG